MCVMMPSYSAAGLAQERGSVVGPGVGTDVGGLEVGKSVGLGVGDGVGSSVGACDGAQAWPSTSAQHRTKKYSAPACWLLRAVSQSVSQSVRLVC